jgi:signal transduction histidine kinase/tetratricopeptide (TPR) repeat protein
LFLLLPAGCAKAPDKILFRESTEQPRDSTCSWLGYTSHFHDPGYYPVFRAYYDGKLQEKQYEAAAEALGEVAKQEMYFLFFKDETLGTVRTFQQRCSRHIPRDKSLVLTSYIGNYYLNRSEFRKAISYFKKVAQFEPVDYNSCIEVAHAYGDMAFCYSAVGEHEQALQTNLKALAWFDKTDNITGKGGIYDNIALVHLFTKNYAEADVYFDKAMDMYRQNADTNNMFTTLHNKILLYQETDDSRQYMLIDSAYRFFHTSALEDDALEVSLTGFYVEKLLHEKRMTEVAPLLDAMKRQADKLQSPATDAEYYIVRAKYEIKTGKGIVDKAVVEKALQAVEENEGFENQIAFCEVLKENAMLRGDYKSALAYAEKEKQALNGLTNREMIAQTMQLNKKHQNEKKEHRIALQEKAIINKNTAIALLGALLIAFCLAMLIVLSLQKQRKIRAEGRRALQYTRKLLEKTEEERKRIAGDLHDSVSHELLNLKHTIGGTDNEAGSRIDGIIHDIRIISRNLHPVMFEKVGLAASIEQLVERAQSAYDLMVTTDIEYDGSLSTSDELQIYRIIQEALSNTIKYAAAVAAKISLFSRNDGIHIEIRDNGKGFSVAEKLSASDAFGLHNILERSRAIGGMAKLSSGAGGTVITIEIKKQ